jgi:antitoxin CptB
MAIANEDLELRRRRARYRAAHRGTKEMDFLLGRFADGALPDMAADELDGFEALLAVADPEIHSWILEPSLARGGAFEALIERIRVFHRLVD